MYIMDTHLDYVVGDSWWLPPASPLWLPELFCSPATSRQRLLDGLVMPSLLSAHIVQIAYDAGSHIRMIYHEDGLLGLAEGIVAGVVAAFLLGLQGAAPVTYFNDDVYED